MTSVRWTCPNDLHPGVLGPSKPRRDNLCRYCLPCSEKVGKLVERVVPKLEAKREAKRERASEKAKAARAKARQERKNRPLTQADFVTRFRCGVDAHRAYPFHWPHWPHNPDRILVEVREAKSPRSPKMHDGRIVIYDHGGDKYDATAQAFCAILLRHGVDDGVRQRGNLRHNAEIGLHVRPRLDGGLKNAWIEIAHLLRSRDAVKVFRGTDDDDTMGRTGT